MHNIKQICPNFYKYLFNTYQLPAKLIINDTNGTSDELLSDEGSTQGDVPAMAMYAIGTKPLVDKLGEVVDPANCKQVWFADDSSSAGKIVDIKKWWDTLYTIGPKYGYFPKPSKTIMIVKTPEMLDHANAVFEDSGITIVLEGERHLGAVIGSNDFKESFVSKKVGNWIRDIEELSDIAQDSIREKLIPAIIGRKVTDL